LKSGRAITLETLDQQMTYAGLVDGLPRSRFNDRLIESAMRDAERYCVVGTLPHLIPPPRRNYLWEPGDMQPVVAQSGGAHVPEWLPEVRCIGAFKDVVKVRDPSRDLSVLVVVWFQDEYALPIREPALSQLLELDWESLATDIDI
jgi:hypothetical protein